MKNFIDKLLELLYGPRAKENFTEKEIEILNKVGFKVFSEDDLKKMSEVKRRIRKLEEEKKITEEDSKLVLSSS